MSEKLIIIDELNPKPKLDEVLNLSPAKRIDYILDDYIPERIQDYENMAIRAGDNKRQERMTDNSLKDALFFLLRDIDTSAMNEPEIDAHKKILDRYRTISRKEKD